MARLTALVLSIKGTVCHLCGDDGADSPDHDPPRSELLGTVPDPDALVYLFPAHRLCNIRRLARPITFELRMELRAKRERDVMRAAARSNLSPRFARNTPQFLRANTTPGSLAPSRLSLGPSEKRDRPERPTK